MALGFFNIVDSGLFHKFSIAVPEIIFVFNSIIQILKVFVND